ncbi:MAG: hypothetical protein OXQ94_03135 [Gemmatimonadota bacterium]|nr:hypothetical protein [Gemmatimonadota bacterium]MDE2870672.1 hypothetical protein [Gemmatimonadota bacterium]
MPLPCFRTRAALVLLAFHVLGAPLTPVRAQHDGRMWGRAVTRDGDIHEGFIHVRAARSSGSWADVLLASREIPEEHYRDWTDATRGGRSHTRVLELKGHRISWVEKHPAFVGPSRVGVRFGHIAELTFDDEGRPTATIRSRHGTEPAPGDTVTRHSGGEVRIESFWRGAEVWVDKGDGSAKLRGRDIEQVEFGPAPAGRVPASLRLYGTVEDKLGRSFTGFVTWDLREILESHFLVGFWEDVPGLANPWRSDEYLRSFRFADIRSLERTPCFARVILKSDSVVELCNEPLEPDPEPVQISDPALGLVEVEWHLVRVLRFERAPGTPGYDAFDGGRPLSGTVVTSEGEEIAGRIRWDADEEWSRDLLQGSSDGVELSIEFGNIAHIERKEPGGARVTLRDGRSFHLTGGNDVDEDNRGIFIFSAAVEEPAGGRSVAERRYVAWEDFREARFHLPDDPGSGW